MIVKLFQRVLIFLLLILSFNSLKAEESKHLEDLRILETNTLPQNNGYQHRHTNVQWKGSKSAKEYICKCDCSGLVNALLSHSYGIKKIELLQWMGSLRPKAVHYAHAIREEKKFKRINKIQQAAPGDLIALQYRPDAKLKTQDTGHLMVVDAMPKQRVVAIPPIVPNTIQWEVTVIDSSKSGHGVQDTRFRNGNVQPGLGKGIFRVYTDQEGNLVGYTMSTSPISKYYDFETRHIYIGRLIN